MSEQRPRYLAAALAEDLEQKMVFIGGPRQVGKTTLAHMLAGRFHHPVYLNWDNRTDQQAVLQGAWPPTTDYLIFDELHKYTKWKSLIKGIWDTRRREERVVVTGSSRLDLFRRVLMRLLRLTWAAPGKARVSRT